MVCECDKWTRFDEDQSERTVFIVYVIVGGCFDVSAEI